MSLNDLLKLIGTQFNPSARSLVEYFMNVDEEGIVREIIDLGVICDCNRCIWRNEPNKKQSISCNSCADDYLPSFNDSDLCFGITNNELIAS